MGLGPYQVTEWTQQYVEAKRFVDADGKPAYFDAATRPGYFDTIRWRYIDNDEAAMNALLNGEVEVVREAIDKGGIDVNELDYEKRTGLHIAAAAGQVVQRLHAARQRRVVVGDEDSKATLQPIKQRIG